MPRNITDNPTPKTVIARRATRYLLRRMNVLRLRYPLFHPNGLTNDEIMERLNKHKFIKPNGCWGWAAKKDHGYARVKIAGKQYRVIRIICCIFHGLVIDDLSQQANHKLECYDKECWNPDHLYVGSHLENQRDRVEMLKRRNNA